MAARPFKAKEIKENGVVFGKSYYKIYDVSAVLEDFRLDPTFTDFSVSSSLRALPVKDAKSLIEGLIDIPNIKSLSFSFEDFVQNGEDYLTELGKLLSSNPNIEYLFLTRKSSGEISNSESFFARLGSVILNNSNLKVFETYFEDDVECYKLIKRLLQESRGSLKSIVFKGIENIYDNKLELNTEDHKKLIDGFVKVFEDVRDEALNESPKNALDVDFNVEDWFFYDEEYERFAPLIRDIYHGISNRESNFAKFIAKTIENTKKTLGLFGLTQLYKDIKDELPPEVRTMIFAQVVSDDFSEAALKGLKGQFKKGEAVMSIIEFESKKLSENAKSNVQIINFQKAAIKHGLNIARVLISGRDGFASRLFMPAFKDMALRKMVDSSPRIVELNDDDDLAIVSMKHKS